MKALSLLLLSFFFILSITGCGGEDYPSIDEETDTQEENEDDTKEPDGEAPSPGSLPNQTPPTTPVAPSTPSPFVPGGNPCSAYTGPCANDKECGEKYLNCLKPKAGPPSLTEQTICVKEGQPNIILILSEWNGSPGKNNLLCDLIEDNEYLIQFATNTKNTCRVFREQRKTELTTAEYKCSSQQ